MRSISMVIFVFTCLLLGCGGRGASSSLPSDGTESYDIAYSRELIVGPEGATESLENFGVTVSFPPKLFSTEQKIQILIDLHKPARLGLPDDSLIPMQVGIRFNPSAVTASKSISVFVATRKAEGAALSFGRLSRNGSPEPVLNIEADAKGLTAFIPMIQSSTGGSSFSPGPQNQDYWLGLAAVQSPYQFINPLAQPNVKVWDGNSWELPNIGSDELKRVGLVVPGMNENLEQMSWVADRMAKLRCNGKARYDRILGVDYPWGNGVKFNSKGLNSLVRSYSGTNSKIDAVAHSMGGLVVRDAIAFGSFNVDNFVMLGTPNGGVPLSGIRALLSMIVDVDKTYILHGLADLLNTSDPIKALAKEGLPTAKHTYLVVGTDHERFYGGIGSAMAALYAVLGNAYTPLDGIVPANLAKNVPGLTATAEVPLNHSELVNRVGEITAIDEWLKCESDYLTTVEGRILENGFFNLSNPNVEIQNIAWSSPLGQTASWDKSTTLKYGGDFSGSSFARGSIGQDINMQVQAEHLMNHAGGGMINFGGISAATTIRIYVPDKTQRFRLDCSRTSESISQSNPNDGRPGTNSQGTSGTLWINDQRFNSDISSSIEIKGSGNPVTLEGKSVYLAATITAEATASGGFTAIIGVPAVQTIARTKLVISAKVTRL